MFDVDRNGVQNAEDATYIFIGLSMPAEFGGQAILRGFHAQANPTAPASNATAVWDHVQQLVRLEPSQWTA